MVILGHLKYFAKEEDNHQTLEFLSRVCKIKATDPFEKMLNAMNKVEMKELVESLKKEKKTLLKELTIESFKKEESLKVKNHSSKSFLLVEHLGICEDHYSQHVAINEETEIHIEKQKEEQNELLQRQSHLNQRLEKTLSDRQSLTKYLNKLKNALEINNCAHLYSSNMIYNEDGIQMKIKPQEDLPIPKDSPFKKRQQDKQEPKVIPIGPEKSQKITKPLPKMPSKKKVSKPSGKEMKKAILENERKNHNMRNSYSHKYLSKQTSKKNLVPPSLNKNPSLVSIRKRKKTSQNNSLHSQKRASYASSVSQNKDAKRRFSHLNHLPEKKSIFREPTEERGVSTETGKLQDKLSRYRSLMKNKKQRNDSIHNSNYIKIVENEKNQRNHSMHNSNYIKMVENMSQRKNSIKKNSFITETNNTLLESEESSSLHQKTNDNLSKKEVESITKIEEKKVVKKKKLNEADLVKQLYFSKQSEKKKFKAKKLKKKVEIKSKLKTRRNKSKKNKLSENLHMKNHSMMVDPNQSKISEKINYSHFVDKVSDQDRKPLIINNSIREMKKKNNLVSYREARKFTKIKKEEIFKKDNDNILADLEKELSKDNFKKSYTSFMVSGNFDKQFEEELQIKVRKKRTTHVRNETSNDKSQKFNPKTSERSQVSLKKLADIETDSKFFEISEMNSYQNNNISNISKQISMYRPSMIKPEQDPSINWNLESKQGSLMRLDTPSERVRALTYRKTLQV